MLRPWGTATAFKPARAGVKRNSEGKVADIGKQLLKRNYKLMGRLVNTEMPLKGTFLSSVGIDPIAFDIDYSVI